MSYSREEIMSKINDVLKNPATLYAQPCVNYKGSVDEERYSEIIAQELMKSRYSPKTKEISGPRGTDLLNQILELPREESYKTKGHEELAYREKPVNTNRDEEWIAIDMYRQSLEGKEFDSIGKILDFQVPLKNVSDDKIGKIDLLSYNESKNVAYILELKRPGSDETLLRCALEAYTYWKTAQKEKLLRDFGIEGAELRKAVLIYKDCLAYKDFTGEECDQVYELMTNKLKVDLFVLNEDASNVIEGYIH